MRLLIVGTLKGQLTTATKIAMDNGATVTHAEDSEQAMRVVRGGKGADLLLVDVALDIRNLVIRLEPNTSTFRLSPAASPPMPAQRLPPFTRARRNTSRCRPIRN